MIKRIVDLYNYWENKLVRAMQSKHAFSILFLVAYAENVFSPIPGDVLVAPLAARPEYKWRSVAFFATLASLLGAITAYGLGYFFYTSIGDGIIHFYNLQSTVDIFQSMYAKYGLLTMFVVGFTPIPDKVFCILSGSLAVPLVPFALAMGSGRCLRYIIVAYLADKYGRGAYTFIKKELPRLMLFAALLIIFAYLFFRFAVQ